MEIWGIFYMVHAEELKRRHLRQSSQLRAVESSSGREAEKR
jgi:hypothetical protein